MSLTNAMLTGFTGIHSNTVGVDTVGNNLANINTTAFKSQRTLLENLSYQTIHEGQAPSATTGGTLPVQIGHGSTVASLQRNFGQGGLEGTGFNGDLAIDGRGFFVVQQPAGEQAYTRDGAFRLDATSTLVSSSGRPLLGYGADGQGNVDTSSLAPIVVPLGTLGDPIPTSTVNMEGQLESTTEPAAVPGISASAPLTTAAGAPATASTPLTDLVDSFGVPLFATGDVLSVGGSKGGLAVVPGTFEVGTTGSTAGDLAGFMETVLGLQTDPALGDAGVTIGDGTVAPAGSLVVTSNAGEINAVELTSGSIVNQTGVIASPFTFSTVQEAVGGGLDGATTSFNVFDSLGNPVDVRLRFVMESRGEGGTVWRYFAESEGDSDLSPALGTGTVSFDANGRFVSAENTSLSIDRDGAGSVSPLTFNVDFSDLTGVASTDGATEVSMADQDGKPAGVMIGYTIGDDGVVTAEYSNTDSVVLGQVALATFVNDEGLIALSDNMYTVGPDSGDATIGAPQTGSAGAIRAGFLEQSNVEIAQEFINLITHSTGISAASRVVRASDDMLQELLLLAR